MRDVSPVAFAKGLARRTLLVCLFAAPLFAAVAPAQAATPAEAFVQANIDKGLQILGNKHDAYAERAAQFQTFLEGLTDIDRIAKFTLGNARRTASPADIASFGAAFKDYVIAVYQSRLSKYTGQTLKVTGSSEHAPGDFVVTTVLLDPSDTTNQQPLEVDFRVVNGGGHFMVIDVSVAGIWLALEERDQFSAFLGQNNGSIPALVAHLNQLTTQLKASNAR
jgi:phospholipid transport system substrate-binding protein